MFPIGGVCGGPLRLACSNPEMHLESGKHVVFMLDKCRCVQLHPPHLLGLLLLSLFDAPDPVSHLDRFSPPPPPRSRSRFRSLSLSRSRSRSRGFSRCSCGGTASLLRAIDSRIRAWSSREVDADAEDVKEIWEREPAVWPTALASPRAFWSAARFRMRKERKSNVSTGAFCTRARGKERTDCAGGGISGEALGIPDGLGPVGALLVDLDELDELGIDARVSERLGAREGVVEVEAAREGEVVVVGELGLQRKERLLSGDLVAESRDATYLDGGTAGPSDHRRYPKLCQAVHPHSQQRPTCRADPIPIPAFMPAPRPIRVLVRRGGWLLTHGLFFVLLDRRGCVRWRTSRRFASLALLDGGGGAEGGGGRSADVGGEPDAGKRRVGAGRGDFEAV